MTQGYRLPGLPEPFRTLLGEAIISEPAIGITSTWLDAGRGFSPFESPGCETNNHLPVWLNSHFGAGVARILPDLP